MRKVVATPWLLLLMMAFASGRTLAGQDRDSEDQDHNTLGAVFVMTNASDQNEVISFERDANGSLREAGRFATGGRGTGGLIDPLESQGSLTLSQDGALLFAVNAGSGEVSVFRVRNAKLQLRDKVPSGGAEPNAIAQRGGLVYVLNVGGSSNVVGFFL